MPTSRIRSSARAHRTSSSSYEWASHLEAVAELPLLDEFHQALGRFSRLLWFDMRGIGMSRSRGGGGVIPVESWVDDLEAVMDALGVERGDDRRAGPGGADGGRRCCDASRACRRLSCSSTASPGYARADDYPAGMPPHVQELYWRTDRGALGNGGLRRHFSGLRSPTDPGSSSGGLVSNATERLLGLARARFESILALDVRDVLPLVDVPTLVVHNRDDAFVRVGHGRYLAEHISRRATARARQRRPLAASGARSRRCDRGVRHRVALREP